MNASKTRLLLWAVIVFATLLRMIILVTAYNYPERTLTTDSVGYIRPAMVFVNEGAYNDPSAVRTPGYPIFLAAIFTVFGQKSFAVVVVQILLNLLTCYFLYKIARLLLPLEESRLAFILFALSFESICTTFFLLTETLFTLLLAIVAWALVRYRLSPAWTWAALAGILTGLAILTRPIAILHPLIVMLALTFAKTGWKTRLAHASLSLALAASLVTPWLIRNYSIHGIFTLSTISDHYLLFYEATLLLPEAQYKPINQVRVDLAAQVDKRMQSEHLPNTEANLARVESEMAVEIIRDQPFKLVAYHLREDIKGFLPGISLLLNVFGVQEDREHPITVFKFEGRQAALKNYFGEQTWLILLFIPYFIFLGMNYLGGAIGVVSLLKRKAWFELTLLLVPIFYYLGLPGGASNARFRVPIMPYLCLLAGIGLIYVWRELSARFKKTSSPA